ncbi:MAG: radical SAM protein [Deltaproteobacteria bacterium]|nr:radical SAM protein [Deltaproteobacteria bacterium]
MPTATTDLRITEILRTIEGESSRAGLPCALIRLSGCPLRCRWCDTRHAYPPGPAMTVGQVLERVAGFGVRRALVTGGEPLAQVACLDLLRALVAAGYETQLETSGALDIGAVPSAVRRIVDVKTPSSGESARMVAANLDLVGANDEVKFVIADRADFDYSVAVVQRARLCPRCEVLFSPVYGELDPALLARWILDCGVDARLNLQLHKLVLGSAGDAALTAG